MLDTMLQALCRHMDSVCIEDVTQGLRACFKVLSKIQMPVAYMEVEAGVHTEKMELQTSEEETTKTQASFLFPHQCQCFCFVFKKMVLCISSYLF